MKFMKYALLTLIIAIATEVISIFAYLSPGGTAYYFELAGNKYQWTSYRTKNTWSIQTYKNVDAFTWLTDSCPNCQIAAKPYTESGDNGVATIVKPGQTGEFLNPTSFEGPDDYRLRVWRFDTTLLTTYHGGFWTMNA